MTYKKIKVRFIKGEPIERFFGRREITNKIGNDKVTNNQIMKLKQELEVDVKIYSGGFTRHIITYKPNHNESI